MMAAFYIWLCGGLPATLLVLECRPHSMGQWLAAIGIVVLWPLALLAFFIALLRSEEA